MGYDSFGLPAEQYAIETGQHPAVTTENNITTFRIQLDKIGFSFDWNREVRTSDPNIINGRSGSFCNYLKAGTIAKPIGQNQLKHSIPKLKDVR